MRWTYTPAPPGPVRTLCRELSVTPIIAHLLFQRGLDDPAEAERFLNPMLRNLDDPFNLVHMDRAVKRLCEAMRGGEEIVVFGDYDVDGITSTVLLVSILRRFGIAPRYCVPLRLEEGYGLSSAALDRVLKDGVPNLLIAVDCGTNAAGEVASLHERGVDTIVIDHHSGRSELPPQCILVNPHVHGDETTAWTDLCSVGLVFKLVHALLKRLREEGEEEAFRIQLKEYLDLVAMGTIADLVPLREENRILAKAGLETLRWPRRMGLKALFEASGMTPGEEVSPFDISFRLGPRINASGRLADASLPVEMLLGDDWERCDSGARMLDKFNTERQEIERRIFLEAEEMVQSRDLDLAGYVLYDPAWHAGVVGIVASRLTRRFHRPCIVLGTEGVLAKGSGRSITGINLVEVLKRCSHLLDHWGGHPMAVGLALVPEQWDAFAAAFHEAVGDLVKGKMPEPELAIDAWIPEEDVGADLLDQLDRLQPFGQGNPEPVFGLRGVVLKQRPKIFGKGHFRFNLPVGGGGNVSGVAWKKSDRVPAQGAPIDLAATLSWNCWNGRKNPQLTLADWREHED
jgi:single-stranded-DNA-specific exonuclease